MPDSPGRLGMETFTSRALRSRLGHGGPGDWLGRRLYAEARALNLRWPGREAQIPGASNDLPQCLDGRSCWLDQELDRFARPEVNLDPGAAGPVDLCSYRMRPGLDVDRYRLPGLDVPTRQAIHFQGVRPQGIAVKAARPGKDDLCALFHETDRSMQGGRTAYLTPTACGRRQAAPTPQDSTHPGKAIKRNTRDQDQDQDQDQVREKHDTPVRESHHHEVQVPAPLPGSCLKFKGVVVSHKSGRVTGFSLP